MSGPRSDDVADREDGDLRERHESSRGLSLRRRSDEIPALPAVSPATPPAAMSPALRALPDPSRPRLDLPTELVTVSSSRSALPFRDPVVPRCLSAGRTSLATCNDWSIVSSTRCVVLFLPMCMLIQ